MNKKLITGVLIVSVLGVVSAWAKPKDEPQHAITADDIVAKMKTQLRLSDQQVEEVKPIIKDYMAKEVQLAIEEKKQLSRVLTGDQMFTWVFLQNEPSKEKKKHSSL